MNKSTLQSSRWQLIALSYNDTTSHYAAIRHPR